MSSSVFQTKDAAINRSFFRGARYVTELVSCVDFDVASPAKKFKDDTDYGSDLSCT